MSRKRRRELERTMVERKQAARWLRMQHWDIEASDHRNLYGVPRCLIARAISYALDWRLKAQTGTLLELERETISSPKEKAQACVSGGRFVILEPSWRQYPPDWLVGQCCVFLQKKGMSANRLTFKQIRRTLGYACRQAV
jgi:hypothetical protein